MRRDQQQSIYACDEHGYKYLHHSKYDFSMLSECVTYHERKGRSQDTRTWNNCIIMADTETSKKSADPKVIDKNHVVAWTVSLRSNGMNLFTLYGHRPDTMVDTLLRIHDAMKGDRTVIFFHNLPYDYTFLRRFFFRAWDYPENVLNIKPHYPLFVDFENGIQLRDSLMLSQRGLEKWAHDLNVEHQKAVGKWDYDKIRSQREEFTPDELEYIENDTLAGVECIDKTMRMLGKHIYSLPYTQTGIPRGESRNKAKGQRAKELFERIVPSWNIQKILEVVFHGGYTHGNRYILEQIIEGIIQCYDIASSYPFRMLVDKFPMERFVPYQGIVTVDDILACADNYASFCKLVMVKPRLKDGLWPMPVLQYSKTERTINPILDNGRILAAAYVEIWVTEQDLYLIDQQYECEQIFCADAFYARKDYLPKWYRDYVYELFQDKTQLKGGDPILYQLKKAVLNSLYGMMVQKPVKINILENYKYHDGMDPEEAALYVDGTSDIIVEKMKAWKEEHPEASEAEEDQQSDIFLDEFMREQYEEYKEKKTSILCYQWGVWVTAYAQRALFDLGSCVADDAIWLYSDTDSVYATGWNMEKLKEYNEKCKQRLKDAGYDPVTHDGKNYYLGVAELDGTYTQFVTTGAKRYCLRKNKKRLKLTTAGVPKIGVKCLNNKIENFKVGLKFSGKVSGKKLHTYFYNEIYEDENGNLTGDSIDLSPCDYVLDAAEVIPNWELLFQDEIEMNMVDYEGGY